MAYIVGWLGLVWLLSSSALAESGGFDAPPPPPPPGAGAQPGLMPPPPAASAAPVNTPEATAASRYQICFQRMVDAGVNDNAFMKKCLGIQVRNQTQTSSYAPPVPPPQALPPHHSVALSRTDLAAVVQQNLGGLTDCYDNLLAQSRDLGLTPGGLVGALVELQTNGQAQVLALDPQSLPDLSLLNCFRSRIRAWAFPRHTERQRFYLAFALVAKTPQKGSVTLSRGYPQMASGPAPRPRAP